MAPRYRILILVCLGLAAASFAFLGTGGASTQGRTFYVSANGSDRHAGTSPARAWRTIRRVSRAHLQPGDRVLFRGGEQFGGSTLIPRASGSAREPITFGSFGGGRAELRGTTDVWIAPGGHDLAFTNLDFSGSRTLFASAATGPGTYGITIDHCSFHDTPRIGLNIATHADRNWTISHSTFRHIGDSGLIIWGADVSVTYSAITDTGGNSSITWGKHGIYLKGRRASIAYNLISGFEADGISLRSDNAMIQDNTIRGGPIGIAYYDYDARTGTTRVLDNTLVNVHTAFYFSNQADAATGGPPVENFVIRGNFFLTSGPTAVDLTGAPFSRLDVSRNVLRGAFSVAVAANPPHAGGRYTETNNIIFGSDVFMWNSTTMPFADYRASTGLGAGDHIHPLPSS